MRYLLILFILITTHTFAASNLQLQLGVFQSDYFKSVAKYTISYEIMQRSGLAFEIGTTMMQSAKATQDLTQTTLPFAGFKYYFRLPRLPFRLFFGAGFGLNHIPEVYGTNYIGTNISSGMSYHISPYNFIYAKYQMDYGKTLNNGNAISFDGNTISIGIAMSLSKNKGQKAQRKRQDSRLNKQDNEIDPSRRQRSKRDRKRPSAYKKTQELMNDLSWPTY